MEEGHEEFSGSTQVVAVDRVWGGGQPEGTPSDDHQTEEAIRACIEQNPRDNITRHVRRLGEFLTIREVAKAVGLAPHTIRKYHQQGKEGFVSTYTAVLGKMNVHLYSVDDAVKMKKVAESAKPLHKGAPRGSVYNEDEIAERSRLYSRKAYWESKLRKSEMVGDTLGIKQSHGELDKVYTRLDELSAEAHERAGKPRRKKYARKTRKV